MFFSCKTLLIFFLTTKIITKTNHFKVFLNVGYFLSPWTPCLLNKVYGPKLTTLFIKKIVDFFVRLLTYLKLSFSITNLQKEL